MEVSDDLCFSIDVVLFPYKSEGVDDSISIELDFCAYNLDVIIHVDLVFKDESVSIFFKDDNLDMIVVIPVLNLNIVIKIELDFEFVDNLGKSEVQFISVILDGCLEFKDKNSNHLLEFNSKSVFEFRIVDEDIGLAGFEDEYLLFSEEFE